MDALLFGKTWRLEQSTSLIPFTLVSYACRGHFSQTLLDAKS